MVPSSPLSPTAAEFTPRALLDSMAGTPPIDWSRHRAELRQLHDIHSDLRRVGEGKKRNDAGIAALATNFNTQRKTAHSETQRLDAELAKLERWLDNSIGLSPKDLRRMLRNLETCQAELTRKQEAQARLRSDIQDCRDRIKSLEIEQSTLTPPHLAESPRRKLPTPDAGSADRRIRPHQRTAAPNEARILHATAGAAT